jgi:hypothetical protein
MLKTKHSTKQTIHGTFILQNDGTWKKVFDLKNQHFPCDVMIIGERKKGKTELIHQLIRKNKISIDNKTIIGFS